jgi:hypothetical protein
MGIGVTAGGRPPPPSALGYIKFEIRLLPVPHPSAAQPPLLPTDRHTNRARLNPPHLNLNLNLIESKNSWELAIRPCVPSFLLASLVSSPTIVAVAVDVRVLLLLLLLFVIFSPPPLLPLFLLLLLMT